MPAPRVRPLQEAAAKWVRRAAGATEDYRMGVTGAGARWAQAAAAANQTYQQAVTEAASRGAYAQGVQRAGAGRYERGATEKGTQRYGPGVAVAEGDYSQRVGPFFQAIAGVDLPPRGPRGSEGNFRRVTLIGQALNRLRAGRK